VTELALAPTGMLGPFAVGETLAGRYEVLALLGEGGMGAVYRVRDRELDEHVALKVLKPGPWDASDALARFRREVRLARRVTHPNVARTYDLGHHGAVRFLTMELIVGESVAAAARRRLPLGEVLRIGHEASLGLGAAHAVGVVHRDLKPDNVMLAEGRVALTDFGVARALDGADAHATAGNIVGTPAYMAPEQVEGKPVDGRSDVYALGVMMFELLTATLPFEGDTAAALALARLIAEAPDPRSLAPDLPEGVVAIVRAMLTRQREGRPDAAMVAQELDKLRGGRPNTDVQRFTLTEDLPRIAATKTVVVRPFDGDGPVAPLAADLERALIDSLASSKDVTMVSARTSPKAAGEMVVEGQVRAAGERVRVRARLSSGEGVTLWADHVEGSTQDPFGLEDAFAAKVGPAVARFAARVQAPSDPALRARFIELRERLHVFDANVVRSAMASLEAMRAEAPQDPWIAAALAAALVRIWHFEGCADAKLAARAEELALRAIDIDPSVADAYFAVGSIRAAMCDFGAALRAAQEALRHNRRIADAHQLVGGIMGDAGRLEECVRRLELAIRLEPKAPSIRNHLALALALMGRKDDALQTLAETKALGGVMVTVPCEQRLVVWWRDYERAGQLAEEMTSLRTGAAWEQAIPFLRAYARHEPYGGADAILSVLASPRIAPRRRSMMYEIFADYHADIGETERAFVYLDEAMKLPYINLAWLDRSPSLDSLRASPRFAEMRAHTAERIGQLLR
jgi:serine/threonine-protein kinase